MAFASLRTNIFNCSVKHFSRIDLALRLPRLQFATGVKVGSPPQGQQNHIFAFSKLMVEERKKWSLSSFAHAACTWRIGGVPDLICNAP